MPNRRKDLILSSRFILGGILIGATVLTRDVIKHFNFEKLCPGPLSMAPGERSRFSLDGDGKTFAVVNYDAGYDPGISDNTLYISLFDPRGYSDLTNNDIVTAIVDSDGCANLTLP